VFFQDQDYQLYRHALKEAAVDSDCQVHAYVLMTNHVHLLPCLDVPYPPENEADRKSHNHPRKIGSTPVLVVL